MGRLDENSYMTPATRAKVELLGALLVIAIIIVAAQADARVTVRGIIGIVADVVVALTILVVLYVSFDAWRRSMRPGDNSENEPDDTIEFRQVRNDDGTITNVRIGYEREADERDDSFATYPDWILRLERCLHSRLGASDVRPILRDFEAEGHPDTWDEPRWEVAAHILLEHGVSYSRLHKKVFYPRSDVANLIAGDYNGNKDYAALRELADDVKLGR